MQGIYIPRIQATKGEVWITALSVLVGRLERPVLLRRREETDPELGRYDLHAAVSYFLADLYEDDDFQKDITLWIGKRPLKVIVLGKSETLIVPGSLRIEGVNAEWLE